jgi:hypothetical protein
VTGGWPGRGSSGTLALLVLKTVASSKRMHGHAITAHIQCVSTDLLRVEEGSGQGRAEGEGSSLAGTILSSGRRLGLEPSRLVDGFRHAIR